MSSFDYAPILKLKMGEVTALQELESERKERMLPIFEVVFSGPRKNAARKDRETKLASIIDKFLTKKLPDFPEWLKIAYGSYPFVLDFTLIYVEEVREEAIKKLLGKCHENNQSVIVSVNLADPKNYKELIYEQLKKYGFGLCIRVSRTDLTDIGMLDTALEDIVSKSGMDISQIDLVIDIKEEDDDDEYTRYFNASQNIKSVNEWRNLIFANGVFPETMGILKPGKEHDVPRLDWLRYNIAISDSELKRKPIFSDYSVRYPIYDPEAEKHGPSPAIKYTTESNWRVMRGSGYDYGHYFTFCLALASSSTYYGEDHCTGDRKIKDKAVKCHDFLKKRAAMVAKGNKSKKAKGAGSSEEWVSIGVSHHTVVTLDQLANHS